MQISGGVFCNLAKKKKITVPFLNYKPKAVIDGVLAGHTVAMVTYYVTLKNDSNVFANGCAVFSHHDCRIK